MENLTLLLGRLHPLVVHLPIGILLLLATLELAGRLPRFPRLGEAQRTAIVGLGAAAAVVAALFGWLLSERGAFEGRLVDRHQLLGLLTAGGAVALLLVQILAWRRAYAPMLAFTVAALVATGHYGGALVHGEDYLTSLLPERWQRVLGVTPSRATARPAPTDPARALVFADVIHPILEQRCVSCHGEAKSNGSLRLDSWDTLAAGGKHGALLKPGDLTGSLLIQRLLLPLDHEERMPPRNKPQLTDDELALLEWWVAAGAPSAATVAETTPPLDIAEILADRFAVAEEATALPERAGILAMADILAGRLGIELRPLVPDGPWLAASARLRLREFGDEQLAALAELGPVLHWLDLGETAVTDAGLAQVAAMRELRRLQLDRTSITDAGLEHVAGLAKLESLNLFGTPVTDAGLDVLKPLRRLRRLHLWDTQVTPAAANAFAEAATDERRIRRWQEEIAARERMIQAERFAVTMGESFPAVKIAFPPPSEKEEATSPADEKPAP